MASEAAEERVQRLREEFGRELRRLRQAANLTQNALARRASYHRVTITQVEQGRQPFSRQLVTQVEAALDAQGRLLAIYERIDAARCSQQLHPAADNTELSPHCADRLMPAAYGDQSDGARSISDLVQLAARDSETFVRELAATSNRPVLLEQLHADVHRLAVHRAPAAEVLAQTRPIRRAAFRVIGEEQHPTDDKDLLLLTGYLSGILAYAALDLGFGDAAATNARAAWLAADLAGHNALRAWVRGTQSLITRYKGAYQHAYDLIEDGYRYAGDGTSEIRLLCGEAQCRAQLDNTAATHGALNRAKDARDRVNEPDAVAGLFTFPQAKQCYYAGSSLIWLPGTKEAKVAVQESLNAIELWQKGPATERSDADEALARVYLATALLHLGELDGVLAAIQPVLAIPIEQRISWQGKRLRRIEDLMDARRFRNSAIADQIRAEIEAFRRSLPDPDSPIA